MKHLNRYSHYIMFSLAILLSACAPTQVVTPVQTNTVLPEIVTQPTNTSIPISVPTATAELFCPKVNPDTQFNLPVETSNFEESILDYLNGGGDPANIQPKTTPPEVPSLYAISADIDNDSLSEVIVSTRDLFEKPATIRIYHCEQNDYRLVKSFTPQNISLGIIELETKIFPNEPSFVIIRALRISGWGQDFLAVGWHDLEWQIINLATGSTPSEITLFDQNKDGIKEVFLETKTATTPGGGRSRVIIDTYSWDGKEFTYISSVMPPGDDRVHYLDDAERALKQGNPLLAVAYYEIAARDSDLSSYWTPYELEHNQTELATPYQQAFAYFRIVAIWFYLDRPEVASEYFQEMSDAFPQGKPGNEFVRAAQELSNGYNTGSQYSSSCAKAVHLLDTQYPDIVQNHLGDWGVANPMYFATSDICKLE